MSQRQAAAATDATSLHELSMLLVREREVLELIADGLAGADGADERDLLLRSITSLELHRAISARAVAIELGFDREPTLRELADVAPEEWVATLREHRATLNSLLDEITRELRPTLAVLRREGNVIAFPPPERAVQRSLVDFLS